MLVNVLTVSYFFKTESLKTMYISMIKISQELCHDKNVVGARTDVIYIDRGQGSRPSELLKVKVIWKGPAGEVERVIDEAAEVTLRAYPGVMSKDALIIEVARGYDLGTNFFYRSRTENRTPGEWAERVRNK
jgi:hypothetical protein